jgi:hypothetical protein
VGETRHEFAGKLGFSAEFTVVGDEAKRFSWTRESGDAPTASLGQSRYVQKRVEFDSIAAAHVDEVNPFA